MDTRFYTPETQYEKFNKMYCLHKNCIICAFGFSRVNVFGIKHWNKFGCIGYLYVRLFVKREVDVLLVRFSSCLILGK